MAAPRYLIHIGAHKTGTTYLQQVFHALRPSLRSQGVLVPDIWTGAENGPSHHDLPALLTEGSTDLLTQQIVTLAAQGADTILLSAEDLSRLPEDRVKTLLAVLGNAQVTIVFYCRRWSELLPSIWQERTRHGLAEPLHGLIRAALADPTRLSFVDFGPVLDRYASAFGRHNIRLVSYNHVIDAGLDLADHFLGTFLPAQRALLSRASGVVGTRAHPSSPAAHAELIRALNALHTSRGGERGTAVRAWVHGHIRAPDLAEIWNAMEANGASVTIADDHPALERTHARLWAAWGDRLVDPAPPGARLFTPRTGQAGFVAPAWLEDPAAGAALLRLYDTFRADTDAAAKP